MDEETQITYLLIAHFAVNGLFLGLNIEKNLRDEIDPDDAIATKTELTIHCIISALALFFIFLAANPDGDLSWFGILIGIHLLVSIVVFFVNVGSIYAPWLSWVFEGVSTGVLFLGVCIRSDLIKKFTKKGVPAVGKQFGKLLNFGKRRLK